MEQTVLKADAQAKAQTKTEEPKTVLYVTVSRKTGWGVRMLAEGQNKGLGELLEPVLKELIRGKRIPWSWYDELYPDAGSRAAETPSAQTQESEANPEGESRQAAEDNPPPAPEITAGGEEGSRHKRKSIPEMAAKFGRKRAG